MEEADPINLITRHLSGEATLPEQDQLHHWLAEDEANKKIFNEYLDLWEKKIPHKAEFDLPKGLQRLNYKIDQHEEQEGKSETSSFGWRKIAASVIIFIAAGMGVYFSGKYSEWGSQNISYTTLATADVERTTLTLSDGSVVQLNSNSTFRYPETFTGFEREVYLTGEAFFEVAKDSLHPFVIHADDLTTQVLGTSFNINSTHNLIAVRVATGKVKDKGNEELAKFALDGFARDHKGISTYQTDSISGCILVSDQQANKFHIYPRQGTISNPHEHKVIRIIDVSAIENDGYEVTHVPLGNKFPNGLFVVMSTDKTFHFYDWHDIIGKKLEVVSK